MLSPFSGVSYISLGLLFILLLLKLPFLNTGYFFFLKMLHFPPVIKKVT